jgi:hypothetical protein
MQATTTRLQKITFADMRDMGVRGVLHRSLIAKEARHETDSSIGFG